MIALMFGVALVLSLLVSATTDTFHEVVSDPCADENEVLTAADFVQAALQAEAEGDTKRRNALLREALDNDPEHAPARWHSGYIRLNGEWMSLAQSQKTHFVWIHV